MKTLDAIQRIGKVSKIIDAVLYLANATFVVIEEVDPDNWGIAGMMISQYLRYEQVVAKPVAG
ncbi:MAG: tautomerase family protein [Nitrospira sp.]